MKLLLDECVPRPLRREFVGHETRTIEQAGLKGLENGDLLLAASADFEVFITVDKNIKYQQNSQNLPVAVLIISAVSNRLEHLQPLIPKVLTALENLAEKEITIVE